MVLSSVCFYKYESSQQEWLICGTITFPIVDSITSLKIAFIFLLQLWKDVKELIHATTEVKSTGEAGYLKQEAIEIDEYSRKSLSHVCEGSGLNPPQILRLGHPLCYVIWGYAQNNNRIISCSTPFSWCQRSYIDGTIIHKTQLHIITRTHPT